MYQVLIFPQVLNDFGDYGHWAKSVGQSQEAIERYIDDILSSLESLEEFPYRGTSTFGGTYELVLVGTPFTALYRILEEQKMVEVLALKPDRLRKLPRY